MSFYKYCIVVLCLSLADIPAYSEALIFSGPSTDNAVHYTVKNLLSPRITRTISVSASSDNPVQIKSPVTQKVKLLPGQSHTFTFVFDIACISKDTIHAITFFPTVSSGDVQTDPRVLTVYLVTHLNKCQQCDNGTIIPRSCPEPSPCMEAIESCHPFSGCQYTPLPLRKCNETVLDSYAIHYSNDTIVNENHSTTDPDAVVLIHHYPIIRSINTHPADDPHIWLDDALPDGAIQMDTWEWSSSHVYSGKLSHTHPLSSGSDFHYCIRSEQSLTITTGENFIQYVWLDPEHCPKEILIQFYVDNGDGEHRVYWGDNAIPTGGTNGTQSLFHMGALPVPGQWTRLRIPASIPNISNNAIKGIAFGVYQGIAFWDRSTTSSWQRETQAENQAKAPLTIPYYTSITHFSYSVTQADNISCVVTPINDQQTIIQTFEKTIASAGWYDLTWNGLDINGIPVEDGNFMFQCTKADQSLLCQRSFERRSIVSTIHSPSQTAMISGNIPITGKAAAEQFSKYTLAYVSALHPLEWTSISESDIPVYPQQADAGLLGTWRIPETLKMGEYMLRLRVYSTSGSYMDDQVSVYISTNVSSQGKTIVSGDVMASIDIPPGAIVENTLLFSLARAVDAPDINPKNWTCIGSVYQLLPAEYHFLTPCTLNIRYTDLQVMGINTSDLYIFYYHPADKIWLPLPTLQNDDDNVLSTTLTDLSIPLKIYMAILYQYTDVTIADLSGTTVGYSSTITPDITPKTTVVLEPQGTDQHPQTPQTACLSQLTLNGGHTPSVLFHNQHIVFMSERSGNQDIWIINATDYKEHEDTATPLTTNPSHDRDPACSPIDNRIAFVSDRDGTYRIYLIESNGTGLKPLTKEVDPNAHPSWSPDGSQLVYIKNNNFFVINTDGTNETMITSDAFEKKLYPVWSHDGTRIAYTITGFQSQLAILEMNGLTKTVLNVCGMNPEWGQDDSFLLYSHQQLSQGIYGINYGNLLTVPYVHHVPNTQDICPVFFPNSQNIAFESTREGIANVWLMTPVTIDFFSAAPRRFSPNGDGIMDTTAFSFKLSGGQPDVTLSICQSKDSIIKEISVNTDLTVSQEIEWDGTDQNGSLIPDGQYTCTISINQNLADKTIAQFISITIDTSPPEFEQWTIPIELSDGDRYITMTVISGVGIQSAWLQYGVASAAGMDQPNIVHWNDFGSGLDGTLNLNWSALDGMVLMIRAFAQDVLGNFTYSSISSYLITQSQQSPTVRSSRIAVQNIKNDQQEQCINQLKNAIARLQFLAGMRLDNPMSCAYLFNESKISLENVLTILQSISKDNNDQ